MVIQRSVIFRTLTGFHGGLRRGTAAAVLGAVLVFVAGTPASNAVVFPSEMQSAETMEAPSAETVSSDTQAPADPKGTPAPPAAGDPPAAGEGKPDKPVTDPPVTEPAPPNGSENSGQRPSAVPAVPAVPAAPGAAGASPSQAATPSISAPPSESSSSGASSSAPPSYGSIHSYGSTTAEKQPMKQVSDVDPFGASPLVWWGIGLVLLSVIAGMVFLRLRST
jgi:hypothetical protein